MASWPPVQERQYQGMKSAVAEGRRLVEKNAVVHQRVKEHARSELRL